MRPVNIPVLRNDVTDDPMCLKDTRKALLLSIKSLQPNQSERLHSTEVKLQTFVFRLNNNKNRDNYITYLMF